MSEQRDKRLEDLLRKIVHLSVEERQAFLDRACADDVSLRQEAESILSGQTRIPDEASPEPQTRSREGAQSLYGMNRIGAFQIKRLIASGGMGSVFEAIQDAPLRTVALKVLTRGITSREMMRRFEFEAQILGRLRHPNIAQVYDAGVHDDGSGAVPYFAMEYVEGARPLVDYARATKLTVPARLQMFITVCDAVHHGHQKGVIHRDLKPGNILVDTSGEPKIIDFGVARVTDSDLIVTTLQTKVGQLIGTIPYMSPEQFASDPHDLDIRSDVYALGVVLYELLAFQLPLDVTGKSIPEAARMVVEDDPRAIGAVVRELKGDLDAIVMKAMSKDRRDRYQSAEALKADVQRYLLGETVLAGKKTRPRLARAWVRKRRTPVAVSFLIVSIMLLLTAPMIWSNQRSGEFTAGLQRNLRSLERDLSDSRQSHAREREITRELTRYLGEAARRYAAFYLVAAHPPKNPEEWRETPAAMDALQYLRSWVQDTQEFAQLKERELLRGGVLESVLSGQAETEQELVDRARNILRLVDYQAAPWRLEFLHHIEQTWNEVVLNDERSRQFNPFGVDEESFDESAAELLRIALRCFGDEVGWTRRNLTPDEAAQFERDFGVSFAEAIEGLNIWGTDIQPNDLLAPWNESEDFAAISDRELVSRIQYSAARIAAQPVGDPTGWDLNLDLNFWWSDPAVWIALGCGALGLTTLAITAVVRFLV